LDKLTPEYSSESSSRTASSWSENRESTPEPEPDSTSKPKEEETTLEPVREEVLVRAECQLRFSGSEDKESSEDYSENTDKPKKSIELFTTNSILPQRETSSKTEPSWLKPFSRKRARRSKPKSWRPNKTQDVRKINKSEKREPTSKTEPDCDKHIFKSHKLNLINFIYQIN